MAAAARPRHGCVAVSGSRPWAHGDAAEQRADALVFCHASPVAYTAGAPRLPQPVGTKGRVAEKVYPMGVGPGCSGAWFVL